MKTNRCAIIATAFVIAGMTAATAQDVEFWGSVENWDIVVDRTVGDGCRIQSEFDDGTFLVIGYDANEDTGYLAVFNTVWGDVVAGDLYDIEIAFDDAVWEAEAEGIYANGVPGGEILVDSVDFLYDMADSTALELWSGDEFLTGLDLSFAAEALDEVVRCQDAQ
jgi:hypothetical protein